MKKLLLIDGMATVYRGYYALNRNPRVNSKGMNTSAILGFTTTLYDLIRSQHPTHIGVAFDLPKPTFRHEMYAEYKANRDAMPEEIKEAIPYVYRMVEAFNIPILTCEGFEADDVIGTLSHQAELSGFDQVYMVSPDKDFAQLVTPCVKLYRFGRMGHSDMLMGPSEVYDKFGVADCRQVIDLLGLWGDVADNIPGIRGVGEKSAKKLIAQFGSIEEMVARSGEIANDKLRRLVQEHADDALFSKQLATIRLDAPISFDEEQLRLSAPDFAALRALTDHLEFRQFARKVFTDLSVSNPDLAQQWIAKQPAPSTSKQASSAASTTEPTLFDFVESSAPVTPEVTAKPLSKSALESFQGHDVAILIDGARLFLATDADNAYCTTLGEVDIPLLRSLLECTTSVKLCHNLKQLRYLLCELDISLNGNIFDVELAHYLLDAEMRHTLDFICQSVLGFAPTEQHALCSAMWQLYPLMVGRLRDAELDNLYFSLELPLVDVLIDMERTGVRIDVDELRNYARRLTDERLAIEERIYSLAGCRFNISSTKQLGEVLYEQLKITDRPPRTARHQYSTAEDVLLRLADSHPIVPLILEYRSLAKLVGTYLDTFPKLISPIDHRLHTIFNQTVTATGRLSSSNPNLQNIPIRTERGREIRKAFVAADAEHIVLAADYSQIELRIIASLAADQHMLDAFNSGFDIHAATAAKIYGIPLEEVSRDQRRNAKSVNFGIVYGISAFGLSQQLDIPRREAAALIEQYFAQYPAIRSFIDASIEKARACGYAATLLGRRRYLPDINSRNASARSFAERNAVNMPIQGTSADMIKRAMVDIYAEFSRRNLQSKMILQVHDELVFDVLRAELDQVRAIVVDKMRNAMPLPGLEVEVGVDVGDNWLEAH